MTLLLLVPACRDDEQDGAASGGQEVIFDVSIQNVQSARGTLPAYDDMPVVTDRGDTCYLGVSVSTGWPVAGPATRASLSNTAALQSSSAGFGLYQYDGSTQSLDNVQYKYAAALWSPQYSLGAVWPGSGTTTFYAYAPYTTPCTWTDNSKLSFTVDASNSDQTDLLVARNTCTNVSSGRVALTFTHALTVVRFVANNNINLTIKSIAFNDVANSGKYDFSTSAWTDVSGSTSTSIEFALPYRSVTGSESLPEITYTADTSPNDEYFLMMPQAFTASSARIVITLSDGSTLVFPLNGTAPWEPGTVVTYELKKTAAAVYVFEVSNDLNAAPGVNDTPTCNVTSQKDGAPWPFTVEYSTDGNNWTSSRPSALDWLTLSNVPSGTPAAAATEIQATVTADGPWTDSGFTVSQLGTELASRPALGTSGAPHDLSYVNVATDQYYETQPSRSTANCYVVQAPGWYKIPLVYGNAIKNGADNTRALSNPTAIDHAGNRITSPWIAGATSVTMLWQDASGLVTDLSIVDEDENGTNDFVYFQVPVHSDILPQGNCLLAVKNSSDVILWSWHIWVAFDDMTVHPTLTINSTTYPVSPVEIGYCAVAAGSIYVDIYHARLTRLRLTQAGSGNVLYVNVYQPMKIGYRSHWDRGYAPYYQWGVKNPFPPSTGMAETTHALYGGDGNPISSYSIIRGACTSGEMKKTVTDPLSKS